MNVDSVGKDVEPEAKEMIFDICSACYSLSISDLNRVLDYVKELNVLGELDRKEPQPGTHIELVFKRGLA